MYFASIMLYQMLAQSSTQPTYLYPQGFLNFLYNFHPNLKFSYEKSDVIVSIVSLDVSVSIVDKKT